MESAITDAGRAEAALKSLNERLHNAGFAFRAQLDSVSDGLELLVEGSFDFAYRVELHLDFRGVEFTDIKDGAKWPDAWNDDQLSLLSGSARDEAFEALGLRLSNEALLFRFNNSTSPHLGLVAARSLRIDWFGK